MDSFALDEDCSLMPAGQHFSNNWSGLIQKAKYDHSSKPFLIPFLPFPFCPSSWAARVPQSHMATPLLLRTKGGTACANGIPGRATFLVHKSRSNIFHTLFFLTIAMPTKPTVGLLPCPAEPSGDKEVMRSRCV